MIATRFPQRLMHRFHFVKIVETTTTFLKCRRDVKCKYSMLKTDSTFFFASVYFMLLSSTLSLSCYHRRVFFPALQLTFWSSQFSVYEALVQKMTYTSKRHLNKSASHKVNLGMLSIRNTLKCKNICVYLQLSCLIFCFCKCAVSALMTGHFRFLVFILLSLAKQNFNLL